MKKTNRSLKPESLMMSHGYDSKSSGGAIKCPIFQTSTFAFNSAEEGKAFFEIAYGLREREEFEKMGFIYSRLSNPDLEVLEQRLALWDKAETGAVFESGMAAISTVLLGSLGPGDLLLYSYPLYGGSMHFIQEILPKFGIKIMGFRGNEEMEDMIDRIYDAGLENDLKMIYVETPANPTMQLIDIEGCRSIADAFSTGERKVLLAVDNTFLGPLWQHPLQHGADLVIYSATKYIGGHSDVIAGACMGSAEQIDPIREMRTFMGNMASPHTAWLLLRSLETMKLRMDKQAKNAKKIAKFLLEHPLVKKLYYLGNIGPQDKRQQDIYDRHCTSPGAMISFDIEGGEKAAFIFLNSLKLIKLAVSLGSTESLAEHPATMTHAGMSKEQLEELDITGDLVRLSVGVENYKDIISDLRQALDQVKKADNVIAMN